MHVVIDRIHKICDVYFSDIFSNLIVTITKKIDIS